MAAVRSAVDEWWRWGMGTCSVCMLAGAHVCLWCMCVLHHRCMWWMGRQQGGGGPCDGLEGALRLVEEEFEELDLVRRVYGGHML